MSALATGIVMPPSAVTQVPALQAPVDTSAPQDTVGGPAPASTIQVQRPVTYIQLLPGQTPPPGATVIPATAPKPITIVSVIAAPNAPATKQKAPKPIYIKSTQSGKVVP